MHGCLKQELSHLMESYRKFRRSPGHRVNVLGGAYSIEIKYNATTRRWHPHLHVLYDGPWWAHRQIKELWRQASDGSDIVWITPAHKEHARYLAKYAGKPDEIDRWPAEAIREYARAVHGLRMVQTFGSLHNVKLNDSDKPERIGEYRSVLKLSTLRLMASYKHYGALAMLEAVATRWPRLRGFASDLVDLPPPPAASRTPEEIGLCQQAVDHCGHVCRNLSTPLPDLRPRLRPPGQKPAIADVKIHNVAGSWDGIHPHGTSHDRDHDDKGTTSDRLEMYDGSKKYLFEMRERD